MVFDFFRHFILLNKEGSVVRRTARLSILGLSVSLSALFVVISVMTALNKNIRDRMLAVEPHLVVYEIEKEKLENALGQLKIKNYKINFFASQDVILRTVDGKFRGAIAKALPQETLSWSLEEIRRIQSKSKKSDFQNLDNTYDNLENTEVVIGVDLAHSLGVFEGETLLVFPPEGLLLPPSEVPPSERIFVKKILSSNIADIDSQLLLYVQNKALVSMRSTASLNKGYELRIIDPDEASDLKNKLREKFSDVKVETWKDRNSALFFALKLEKIMISLFLSMAALVALLSMVAVVTLLISQKKKEIGLLQALGYSSKGIQILFMKLGLLTSLVGIIIGTVFGLGISLYIQKYPLNVLPEIYYDSEIPALVQWDFVIVVILITLLLSFLGAVVAGRQARGIEPAQMLKSN
jgi:lipoprotein-releasing system permease protein